MNGLLGERDCDFKPSRIACYLRFFGIAAAGWLLAVSTINHWFRLPHDWPGVSGWWWIPFLIVAPIVVIAASVGIFWMMAKFGKWEGPITAFIKADIERLARKTPFPNVCRKILQGVIVILFLPWLLIFAAGSSDS